ncbi:venom allergen 2-like [Anoplolepis gracilipes]|uniref:venom allergen 2-like n=1 Tax=Anoplolepis gracilipes TaxID=354296 RepID=UPI003B9E59B1
MKNFMLMACLLAISYASNPAKVKELYDYSDICFRELNVPNEYTPFVAKCVLQKLKMINEQDLLNKDKLMPYYDNIISDELKLHQAKYIVSTCIDRANQGPGSNDEKTMLAITCAMPVIPLFDKPLQEKVSVIEPDVNIYNKI